jgi:PAS domain S-box-containing protein
MEVMGRLLAAHSLLAHLSDAKQVGELAAHALRELPGAKAAAAQLDDETVLDGPWDREAWERSCSRLEISDAYRWQKLEGDHLLVLPVAALGGRHGWLFVLGSSPARIRAYLPFLANFASGVALTLENQRQRALLDAATEQLRVSKAQYEQLFSTMTSGFGVHEIVTDGDGCPVDYRFLAVNAAFERLTGLQREKIIGRTVLEVLPGLEHEWIERYGRVAVLGRATNSILRATAHPSRATTTWSPTSRRRAGSPRCSQTSPSVNGPSGSARACSRSCGSKAKSYALGARSCGQAPKSSGSRRRT